MLRDNKVLAFKLRLILLKDLGKAYVTSEVTEEQVLAAIEKFTQK